MFKIRMIVAIFAIAGLLLGTSVYAARGNSGETKPGWGYGDKNHVHVGPPGQSVHP